MARPDVRVFLEVDTSNIPDLNFVIEDATFGVMNGDGLLAGQVFIDFTGYLRGIETQRGKTRILDRYDAGFMNVQFDNSRRIFDPVYESSPFFGAIVPRLKIRMEANDKPIYTGIVLDWDLEYDTNGNSIATAVCSDKFTLLAQTLLESEFMDIELSGERIDYILALPEVEWPSGEKDIDTGLTILQGDLIPENQNTLAYLQLVETTERGDLFIAKNGNLRFRQRNSVGVIAASLDNEGNAIPYTDISVVFGSELLFNRIEVAPIDLDTEIVNSAMSQARYGITTLAIETLHEFPDDAQDLANFLLIQYADPEYRFESITIDFTSLSNTDQNALLDIELADLVQVSFLPSKIPPAISLFAKVIGIDHAVDYVQHKITLRLASLVSSPFVLDSPALGVLDEDTLAY